MPLFAICLLVFAVGICLILTARLVRSYPLVFGGLVCVLGASVCAFLDGKAILGIYWLVFSFAAAIASALHLYKNIRGAFWWALGATLALILAAIPWEEFVDNADLADILNLIIAPAAFLVIGLLGSLLVPKLMFKDKDERKHRTNSDLIVGKRITIYKNKEGMSSARGYLNDVDWAIEPLYPFMDEFKVGDVVKVCTIKGVTLLCERDGRDYREEQKAKRKAEAEEARRKEAEAAAKRKAEKEAARKAREEEKAKQKAEAEAARKAREEEEAKRKAEEEAAKQAEEPAKEEQPAEEPVNEPAEEPEQKEEEPVVKEEAEKPVKERAPSKFKEICQSKYDLAILIASCIIFVLSIIVLIILLCKYILWLIFVYLVLALLFAIFVFVMEILKGKNKEEQAVEEEQSAPEPETEPEPQPEPQPEPEVAPEEPAPAKEKPEFIPFQARLAMADDFVRNAYNELKSEALSYGIKSRVSSTSDTFRLHKKAYVRMVVAGKFLKLYFALNPEDYKDTTYPFEDASKLGTKKDTPFVFKIKSGLSIRRAKVLMADVTRKDGLEQKEVIPHDHFADLKEQAAVDDEGEEEDAE